MVSVTIATFNRREMITDAVRAALAQTRPPDEIVIYDDASEDGTFDALSELGRKDSRIRVFRQSWNTGGVNNWNAAIEQARGEFIAWCSDDDRFLPGHLKASVSFLEAHPEIGVVHSSFVDVWNEGSGDLLSPRPLRATTPLLIHRANLIPYLIRHYDWPFHPSTLVIRRRVFDKVGLFDPSYALADTDWFARAVEQFPVVMLPRHGVLNRRHPGNWSNRMGSARMQSEIFAIVERAIDRQWPDRSLRKTFWRAVWRANVRARLALTLAARVRSGHVEAAQAAWLAALNATGRPGPWLGLKRVLEVTGCRAIEWFAASNALRPAGARESVSPL